jgi:RNA polymerase sigma-70 factor (ECF subfamily)
MLEALSASLLARGRRGDMHAQGELLARCQNFLHVLARTQIDGRLRVCCDDSDLVQETLVEALRDFPQFAGTTERELLTWLRRILIRNLADQLRRHKAQARDWQRQKSLEEMLDRSSSDVQAALAQGISSPSTRAVRQEDSLRLADALAKLPEDYRAVIEMRHLQGLKFEEVAGRLGRSSGATRMLWTRALEKLHGEMTNP